MATATQTPLRYQGWQSSYVDIATRHTEHLGLAVEYAVHPSGIGCFIVRLVAHGKGVNPVNYKHLTYREPAKFVVPASAAHPVPEKITGLRLNKIALPVFAPAVQRHEIDHFATKFGVWTAVSEWLAAQVASEGFTLTVDLPQELRNLLVIPTTPEATVTSALTFPDLTAPEQTAAALKLVKKPEPDEDDVEDDDGDEDETEGKDWLN
jgi:hypothetical protein